MWMSVNWQTPGMEVLERKCKTHVPFNISDKQSNSIQKFPRNLTKTISGCFFLDDWRLTTMIKQWINDQNNRFIYKEFQLWHLHTDSSWDLSLIFENRIYQRRRDSMLPLTSSVASAARVNLIGFSSESDEALIRSGINTKIDRSDHKSAPASHLAVRIHVHMSPRWPFLIGSHLPDLYAITNVHYLRVQRLNALLLLSISMQRCTSNA